ncbi:hypothetical protein [Pseudomonas paraeruginosa]|uniref:hypothetical protein n=1 Tax=Pseudomonas aeruginosa TaxID=287 RepID=UPI002158D5FC|nr:hypothetical protein [Pseudomonas aeruginosa]
MQAQIIPLPFQVAAVIGVPLYIRAGSRHTSGSGSDGQRRWVGTVLAVIIGSAGASLNWSSFCCASLFHAEAFSGVFSSHFAMAMIAGYATYLFF